MYRTINSCVKKRSHIAIQHLESRSCHQSVQLFQYANHYSSDIYYSGDIIRSAKSRKLHWFQGCLTLFHLPIIGHLYHSLTLLREHPPDPSLNPLQLLAFLGNSRKYKVTTQRRTTPLGAKRALHLNDLQSAMNRIVNTACKHTGLDHTKLPTIVIVFASSGVIT